MGDRRIHAILTRYAGGGFSLSSPQLPELVAGYDSEKELDEGLISLLRFGGAPEEYKLVKHYQEFSSNAAGEWVVRIAHDVKLKERVATLRSFTSLMHVTSDPLENATKSTTGEATFVLAVLDDTVGWLTEQMTETGCALTVVVRSGNGLTTFDLLTHDLTDAKPRIKVDLELTVAQILDKLEPAHHVLPPGLDFLSGEPVEQLSSSRTPISV